MAPKELKGDTSSLVELQAEGNTKQLIHGHIKELKRAGLEAKERESEGIAEKEKRTMQLRRGADKNQVLESIRIRCLLRGIENQQEAMVMVRIFEYDEVEPTSYLLENLSNTRVRLADKNRCVLGGRIPLVSFSGSGLCVIYLRSCTTR